MDDGRELIKEAYGIINSINEGLAEIKSNFAGDDFGTFASAIKNGLDWAKKCQNKVWLRSKEGTEMASVVLEAARRLQDNLNTPQVNSKAVDFSEKVQHLGRELQHKVSFMT